MAGNVDLSAGLVLVLSDCRLTLYLLELSVNLCLGQSRILPVKTTGGEQSEEDNKLKHDLQNAHKTDSHVQAIVQLRLLLRVVIREPKKKPEHVHRRRDNQ